MDLFLRLYCTMPFAFLGIFENRLRLRFPFFQLSNKSRLRASTISRCSYFQNTKRGDLRRLFRLALRIWVFPRGVETIHRSKVWKSHSKWSKRFKEIFLKNSVMEWKFACGKTVEIFLCVIIGPSRNVYPLQSSRKSL